MTRARLVAATLAGLLIWALFAGALAWVIQR